MKSEWNREFIMQKEKMIQFLEKFAPKNLAEDWDNVGFLLGKREGEVKRVYLCLDVDSFAVKSAIEEGCDFILSHHPFLFKGLKSVTEENVQGKKIISLIENKISVFSMHTNFDSVEKGMADLIAEKLAWKKEGVIEAVTPSENGVEQGIGFFTHPDKEYSCEELANYVKESCKLPYIEYFDSGRKIRKLAVCPGSGRSLLSSLPSDVDAFISGDFGHHDAVDSMEKGLSLINAGHYGLEHFFVPYMKSLIRRHFPEIELIEEKIHFPGKVL